MPNFFTCTRYSMFLTASLLFLASCVIQGMVFSKLTSIWLFGLVFALALELAKVTLIVIKPLFYRRYISVSAWTRTVIATLRLGLIAVSLACATAFLSEYIDRPLIENVRKADGAKLTQARFDAVNNATLHANTKRIDTLQQINSQYQVEKESVSRRYEPIIAELRRELRIEMDNVVNKEFKGPRYAEFERRLQKEERALDMALKNLNAEHKKQLALSIDAINSELNLKLKNIEENFDNKLTALQDNSFVNDERVSLPLIRSMRRLIETTFKFDTTDLAIGFIFALMLAFVGELALYCIFSQLANILAPVLTAQYTLWNAQQIKPIDLGIELNDYHMENEQQKSSVDYARKEIDKILAQLRRNKVNKPTTAADV